MRLEHQGKVRSEMKEGPNITLADIDRLIRENDVMRALLRDLLRAAEQGGWEGGLSAIERARAYLRERSVT